MYLSLLCLCLSIYLVVIAHFLRSGLCSVFHPFTVYAGFHGLLFVFRPFVTYFGGYTFIYRVYEFTPTLGEQMTVIAASTLGFVVFYIASINSGHSPMVFKGDVSRMVERQRMRPALNVMLVICLPLALYSLVHAVNTVATGTNDMVMTATGYSINTKGNGYTSTAMYMLVPICGLIVWLYRFRWYSMLPLAIFFIFKAATGGRGPFVVAIAIAGLFYFYDKRMKLPGLRAAIGIAVVGLIFSAVGADRGYALREAIGITNTAKETHGREQRFLEGMDFATKEYFEYTVHVIPSRTGTYDYFLSNLQILTEPVPRVLWTGKPVGPPIQLFNWYDFGNPIGITLSLPGMGWYEMGWFGVIIWCGLWGWVLGRLYQKFVTGSQSTIWVATYLVSLAIMIIGYRDGAVLTVLKNMLFYLGPIIVLAVARRWYRVPSLGRIQQGLLAQAAMRRAGAVTAGEA